MNTSNKYMLAASSCFGAATGANVTVVNASSSVVSSSLNTCIKLLTHTQFRYDPYSASVIPLEYVSQSPVKRVNASIVALSCSPPPSAVPVTLLTATSSVICPEPTYISSPLSGSQRLNLAPAPSIHSARYAIIKFKQETATFLAPFRIVVGDVVVVEGDRGENIGLVQEITQVKPTYDVPNKVLRHATEKDMANLQTQREKEDDALKMTQSLATSIGLHATIEDVEYQFDLNKLTVYVRRNSKNGFVDFRKLQRGLFREFRCRIWCAYMDEVEAVENGPRAR